MKTKIGIWFCPLIVIGLVLIFTMNCKKEENPPRLVFPVLSTTSITDITITIAISGGNITSDGGTEITARGISWGITQNPTIADSKTTDGTGTASFTSEITDLTSNNTYYVRSFATNSAGTVYGNQLSFTTKNLFAPIVFAPDLTYGTIMDIDGNEYKTIQIGTQIWMAGNLKTIRYRNGDLIGTTAPAILYIYTEATPKYQWAYDGNESYVTTYGRLYTWNAVTDSRNVCPKGWHVPADGEWTTLTSLLGGDNVTGDKLRETGTTHWVSPNDGATNSSGFTSLAGGSRDPGGTFDRIGYYDVWWSSTENGPESAWFLIVNNNLSEAGRRDYPK